MRRFWLAYLLSTRITLKRRPRTFFGTETETVLYRVLALFHFYRSPETDFNTTPTKPNKNPQVTVSN